jgi:hypothetical protein
MFAFLTTEIHEYRDDSGHEPVHRQVHIVKLAHLQLEDAIERKQESAARTTARMGTAFMEQIRSAIAERKEDAALEAEAEESLREPQPERAEAKADGPEKPEDPMASVARRSMVYDRLTVLRYGIKKVEPMPEKVTLQQCVDGLDEDTAQDLFLRIMRISLPKEEKEAKAARKNA